jgi:hypothetical protein
MMMGMGEERNFVVLLMKDKLHLRGVIRKIKSGMNSNIK